MFKSLNQSFILIFSLIFLSGCPNQKNSKSSNNKKTTKNLSIAKKMNQNAASNQMLAEITSNKEITYNYSPADCFDEDLFNSLILSDNKSYQLSSTNGSRISAENAQELEALSLAWEQNHQNLNQALELWQENLPQPEAQTYVCKTGYTNKNNI